MLVSVFLYPFDIFHDKMFKTRIQTQEMEQEGIKGIEVAVTALPSLP